MHSSPYPFCGSGDKRYFGQQQDEYYYSPPPDHYYDSHPTRYLRTPNYHYSMPSPIGPPLEVHENDVLMGRGGRNNQHSGNEKLRQFARVQSDKYRVSSKKEKSAISRLIVRQMRQLDPPARFLKRVQQTATWEEVGDDTAREKASQVLRDAVGGLLEPKDGSEPAEPIPTVSAPASLDEQERLASRARGVHPRPDVAYSSAPIERHHSEPSVAKRRRYSTSPSHAHSQSYDVHYSYSPHPPAAAAAAGVSYSPLRRHSEDNVRAGIRSDQVWQQRYPGLVTRSSPQGSLFPQDAMHRQTPGNLSDFDLFNGELLESDNDDDDGEPLPPDSAGSGAF